jgi:hypothetical protein
MKIMQKLLNIQQYYEDAIITHELDVIWPSITKEPAATVSMALVST